MRSEEVLVAEDQPLLALLGLLVVHLLHEECLQLLARYYSGERGVAYSQSSKFCDERR